MPLIAGTRLGSYEILSPIGKGGMGEVYRARDTKLDREVAIKVLPDEFASDNERLARFEREAKLLASLNHPNIAGIYGLEESDGVKALVLELVEGPTLAERIAKDPIPVDEALPIARQVAEALEAGHEAGVIHRDLKPANVKLKADGTVKVLDYGLAKALEGDALNGADPALSQSPTLTRQGTRVGVILGTAAYMSPEQAKGKSVDRRADIWAFGCVVYEMLTARRAFQGEDVSDTLASVLKDEPDWNALPVSTPPALRKLLVRCLRKNPRERWRHIGDTRIELEGASSLSETEENLGAPSKTALFPWVVGSLVIGLGVAALAVLATRGPGVPEAPLRMFPLADAPELGNPPTLSPDGQKIAFAREGRLWIRRLDRLEPRELPGSLTGWEGILWSSDSENVAFASGNELRRIGLDESSSTLITAFDGEFRGGAWYGSRIVFSVGDQGLFEVPAGGGKPRSILVPDHSHGEWAFQAPTFLPDGEGLLFRLRRILGDIALANQREDTIVAFRNGTKKVVYQIEGGSIGRVAYSRTGHLVYELQDANEAIWAIRFSLAELSVEGEPFLVAADGVGLSLSEEGTLTFVSGVRSSGNRLFWVDRGGRPLAPVGQLHGSVRDTALSPDGEQVAVMGGTGVNRDVWVYDIVKVTSSSLAMS